MVGGSGDKRRALHKLQIRLGTREVGWTLGCVLLAGCGAGIALASWPVVLGLALLVALSVIGTVARRPRRQETSAPVGILTAVALCLAVPGGYIRAAPDEGSTAWLGPATLAIVVGARLAWLAGRGEQRIAEGMVWVFSYVFLGIAPLVQLRLRVDPSTTPNINHELDGATTVVVAAGLAAFALGAVIGSRRTPSGSRVPTVNFRMGRLTLLSIAGIAAAGFYANSVGLSALFASRDELSMRVATAWPNPTTAALMGAASSMPLLVAFVALVQKRGTETRNFFIRTVLPALVLVSLLTVVNPISGARFVVGTVFLAAATAFGLAATRTRFRALLIGSVAGLLFLFPIADAFRRAGSARIEFDPVGSLLTGDFDAWDQINNSVAYLEDHGSTWGRQGLGVLFFWIPRTMWAAKPTDTGVLLAEFRGYQFRNLSAPVWAELLVNGGWVALAIGMMALGWFLRRWDLQTVALLRGRSAPGVVACIVPFYMLILLRGSLLQATAMLAAILACAYFVQDRRPSSTGLKLPVDEAYTPPSGAGTRESAVPNSTPQ